MRAAWLSILVACGRSGEIDFPDRLAPLEDVNKAPEIEPVGGDPYPEVLSLVSGEGLVDDDGEEVYWAHARAWVKADIAEVWAASRDIDVCVDRREVDEWTVDHDTVPGFEHAWTIHNVVHDVLTVEYDITWVHELQEGTDAAPELVVGQWDKTDGTSVIDILRGSLVLRPAADGVTEIELIEHLKAAMRDEETLESYLTDYYDDLLAVVHGEPLPEF